MSGHIIAVVGGKGGVGKSVFAANFALAMAADAKNSPCLLDADPKGSGDLNLILGIKQVKGFGDSLLDQKVPDPAGVRQICTPVTAGAPGNFLYSLQFAQNPERLLTESDDKVDLAIKLMRKSFPITIVDCGSHLEGGVLKILDSATLILVVTNPEILVLNQTRKVLDRLQTLLYPPEMTKILLNRYPQGNPYNPQFVEQTFKRQVLGLIPEDTASAQAALSKGAPFVAMAPNSPATKGLFALSRMLIERRVLDQLATLQKPTRSAPSVASQDKPGNVVPISSKNSKDPVDARSLFKVRLHERLVDKLDLKREQLDPNMPKDKATELRNRATKIITDLLGAEDHPYKARDEMSQIIKEILDETFGLGPLEDMLADDTVTEIMVNRADKIYIEKAGKSIKSPVTFSSNKQLMNVIERIVAPIGRRINESSPYVDARLKDGSRVHAIIPPLALDGPMVTIRKFPKKRLGPEDLVNFGSMNDRMSLFLKACIQARLNVIVSGGTGSGKTTLLNVLSSFIPANERILTVEDAAELQLVQEHVGRLETRPPSVDGTNGVTIRDLVRQTLRMRPDRIIIGEVRDGAALDMLQAMNTGHDGSMATVHANSPRDALSRLETLVMMAGMDLPVRAIREQISGAVNLIVQQTRLSDGSRRVLAITEVNGMEGDVIKTSPIFEYKIDGIDEKTRKVIGKHTATGFMPTFFNRLKAIGMKLPPDLFKAA